MYIIDKNKDYYDYYSHIYGVDKQITFDRRGSIIVTDALLSNMSINDRHPFYDGYEGSLILEIGDVQYLFETTNFKWIENLNFKEIVDCDIKLVHVFRENKKQYDAIISIRGVRAGYNYKWATQFGFGRDKFDYNKGKFEDIVTEFYAYPTPINLPILTNTKIAGIIPAEDIWKELQTYISSLGNDKDVSIPMTDVEKAINHGFDSKTSFRHPIK